MKQCKLYGVFVEHNNRIYGYVGPQEDILSSKADCVKLGGGVFSKSHVKVFDDFHMAELKMETFHGRHLTGAFLSRISKHNNYITMTGNTRRLQSRKTKRLVTVGFTVTRARKKDAPYKS